MRSDSAACAALDACSNAASARPRNNIAGSHPLLPDAGEPDRRHPRFLAPADAAPGDLYVDEIRPPADRGGPSPPHRLARFGLALPPLARDPETPGDIRHVHVWRSD